MAEEKKDVHIIPPDDIVEHIEEECCLCGTEWEPDNKREYLSGRVNYKVIVHNRLKDTKH